MSGPVDIPEEFLQAGVPTEEPAAEEQAPAAEAAPEEAPQEPEPVPEQAPPEPEPEPQPTPQEPAPAEEPAAEPPPQAEEEVSQEVTISTPTPSTQQPGQPPIESGPAQWFYMKPNQKDAVGPVTSDELKHLFAQGKIAKNTLIWCEGMEQWEEIGKLIAFQKTEKVKLSISSHGSPKPGSDSSPGEQK